MTGQIPPYGDDFKRVDVLAYDPVFSSGRIYQLKSDTRYHLRSDKSSKRWMLFFQGQPFAQARSMGEAMILMLELTNVPLEQVYVDAAAAPASN